MKKKIAAPQIAKRGVPLLLVIGSISGCAVTELTAGGQAVSMINEKQAENCRFIESINTNNKNTLSKDPEADAKAQAKNKVAEIGGDSLRVVSTDMRASPSGVGGVFTLQGEAYSCN